MITISITDIHIHLLDLDRLASLSTWNYRNKHFYLEMRKPRHKKLINLATKC